MKNIQEQERATWERLSQTYPQAVSRAHLPDPKDVQRRIGIHSIPDLPKGYIKHMPHDFIVEEIPSENELCTIEPAHASHSLKEDAPTLFADLVKIEMGTLDAISYIAQTLNIAPEKIGYAGIKDKRAITSQRISIRGPRIQHIQNTSIPNLYIKPHKTGKGAVHIGQLLGNRFTILIRTKDTLNNETCKSMLDQLAENGFPNFYGAQRFGNRFLNPTLGKLLCQGNTQQAIREYLTASGPYDIPILSAIRKKAAKQYGNWKHMQEIFNILPYTFRYEKTLLTTLEATQSEHKALLSIQDQVKFWVYGYNSYLVNRLLSRAYAGEQDIPETLPLPFSDSLSDTLYAQDLTKDNCTHYGKHIWKLPFLRQKYRTIPAWITPDIHAHAIIPEGVILSFTLPKGVYATTLLMFLFQIYEGIPAPSWVQKEEIDTKAHMNTGSTLQAINLLEYTPSE